MRHDSRYLLALVSALASTAGLADVQVIEVDLGAEAPPRIDLNYERLAVAADPIPSRGPKNRRRWPIRR